MTDDLTSCPYTARDAAVQAIRRALDSIESAKRELSLGRSALALLDAARALKAASDAHYHTSMARGGDG